MTAPASHPTALGQVQLDRYPPAVYAILRRLAAATPADLLRLGRIAVRLGYHAYADGVAPARGGHPRRKYRAGGPLAVAAERKRRIWAVVGDRRILAPRPATGADVNHDIIWRVKKATGGSDRPLGYDASQLPYDDPRRAVWLAAHAAITALVAGDRLDPADRDWLMAGWREFMGD